MEKIKLGDVVRHKTGGGIMTVEHVNPTTVNCVWFEPLCNGGHDLKREEFSIISLDIIDMENIKKESILEIKRLRVELNKLIFDELTPLRLRMDIFGARREVSICIERMQEARMWLGQALAEMDVPSRYPNGDNPNTTIIDPPTDTK